MLDLCLFSEVTCKLPSVGNSNVRFAANYPREVKFLEIVEFSCVEGYTTDDVLVATCNVDGNLSPSRLPECRSR